jgi:hypothetical protein
VDEPGADPEQAALYRLLVSMIDPYIDSFTKSCYRSTSPTSSLHGSWISCDTPKTRFPRESAGQIQALNKVAAVELIYTKVLEDHTRAQLVSQATTIMLGRTMKQRPRVKRVAAQYQKAESRDDNHFQGGA